MKRLKESRAVQRERAAMEAFNDRWPVGTPVRYWKLAREGKGKESKTRTASILIGGHTAVVWVEGEPACVALTHIEPIAEGGGR